MNYRLRRWLARLLWSARRTSPQFKATRVECLPGKLAPNTVYVIGDDECTWAAALACPCGCAEAIQLSLVNDAYPSWVVRIDIHEIPTLHPSVWRTTGCKSHFILYRGHVFWCRDNENTGDLLTAGAVSGRPWFF